MICHTNFTGNDRIEYHKVNIKSKANELGEGNAAVEADVPEDQQDLQGQGAPFLPAMLEQVQENPLTRISCSY